MNDEDKDTGGVRINISLGKEIDAALGDVLRALLKKPAEEAGSLVGDAIGIYGDKIRRKRASNLQIGLEDVRRSLDAGGVDMKDITPPEEEELHLLTNGLSLSGNEHVRALWVGLFAQSLDPNSGVTAERPFINVLESLSPMDAKILDFLAYVTKVDKELQEQARRTLLPPNLFKMSAEERANLEVEHSRHQERQRAAVAAINAKADEHQLRSISDPNWAVNLMRQGLIEKTLRPETTFTNPRLGGPTEHSLQNIVAHFDQKLADLKKAEEYKTIAPAQLICDQPIGPRVTTLAPQVYLEAGLSSFGVRLAQACGLIDDGVTP